MHDEDPNTYIAEVMPGLVGELLANDVKAFDERRRAEKQAAQELREAQGDNLLTSSELIKAMVGDNEEERLAKLDAEMAQIQKDAQDAAMKELTENVESEGHFPEPVITVGG